MDFCFVKSHWNMLNLGRNITCLLGVKLWAWFYQCPSKEINATFQNSHGYLHAYFHIMTISIKQRGKKPYNVSIISASLWNTPVTAMWYSDMLQNVRILNQDAQHIVNKCCLSLIREAYHGSKWHGNNMICY